MTKSAEDRDAGEFNPAGRLNGSSLGELVNSPSLRCQRSVPGNVAVSEAILDRAERSRGVSDPTDLLLIDEVDRIKMLAWSNSAPSPTVATSAWC